MNPVCAQEKAMKGYDQKKSRYAAQQRKTLNIKGFYTVVEFTESRKVIGLA